MRPVTGRVSSKTTTALLAPLPVPDVGRAPAPDGLLHARWLGKVPYREALAIQHAMVKGVNNHLLLLEHPHVYTLGARANADHVLIDPATVGAELVTADRGGDVTYHGPGQLVGYPILTIAGSGGITDTVRYVRSVEQLLIDALTELGLADVGRLDQYPGVWVAPAGAEPRKIAAIGVKLARHRTMHGFALNVHPDMSMFDHIVPCGISDMSVTSLHSEGLTQLSMRDVVDVVIRLAGRHWGSDVRNAQVAWTHRIDDLSPFSRRLESQAGEADRGEQVNIRLKARLVQAGVTEGLTIGQRKPEWLRPKVTFGPEFLAVKKRMRSLDLVTVCEEAGCPNITECWADGTATFMINGERCTRACGFCLIDTNKPKALDPGEPQRVAQAVAQMGLQFAVITTVARDDLDDDGAHAMAATIAAIRAECPGTQIETLISDCRGRAESLAMIFDARPDVLNHNLETVARLQRAVRPSAGYARSLGVLAAAKAAGLTTKSGLIVGMGETDDEIIEALTDLAAVGVNIVTIGQYLRPTEAHLPVERWVTPEQFASYAEIGGSLGIGHLESSPMTRSSYHARQAAASPATLIGSSR